MARNRSRNFIQRREYDVIPLSVVGTKRSSANPDEEILKQESMQAVMEAIEALPARDRQVVKARIDGLSEVEGSNLKGPVIFRNVYREFGDQNVISSNHLG